MYSLLYLKGLSTHWPKILKANLINKKSLFVQFCSRRPFRWAKHTNLWIFSSLQMCFTLAAGTKRSWRTMLKLKDEKTVRQKLNFGFPSSSKMISSKMTFSSFFQEIKFHDDGNSSGRLLRSSKLSILSKSRKRLAVSSCCRNCWWNLPELDAFPDLFLGRVLVK